LGNFDKYQQSSPSTTNNGSRISAPNPAKHSRLATSSNGHGNISSQSSSSKTQAGISVQSQQPQTSRPSSSSFATPKFSATSNPSVPSTSAPHPTNDSATSNRKLLHPTTQHTESEKHRAHSQAWSNQNVSSATTTVTPSASINCAAAISSQTTMPNPVPAVNSTPTQKESPKEEEPTVVTINFREEKYLKYYNANLTAHRKNWNSEVYANEAKKYADR
jgi:hypothetical protein